MDKEYKLTLVRRLVNSVMKAGVKAGFGSKRTHLLGVRGRKSGIWYETPVNLVVREDNRYVVAPYGITNWVKNARKAGSVRLRRGKNEEELAIEPVEGREAAAVLHQYWQENFITRQFFGVPSGSTDDAFLGEVSIHPVFRLRDSIAAHLSRPVATTPQS